MTQVEEKRMVSICDSEQFCKKCGKEVTPDNIAVLSCTDGPDDYYEEVYCKTCEQVLEERQ